MTPTTVAKLFVVATALPLAITRFDWPLIGLAVVVGLWGCAATQLSKGRGDRLPWDQFAGEALTASGLAVFVCTAATKANVSEEYSLGLAFFSGMFGAGVAIPLFERITGIKVRSDDDDND